mmetsp:Transcript_14168/g.20316  ORF Transcript_14168/g.20316 Transcript_14168/m.20316 type:complete len:83 (-) Transcript_14168:207-455(-)
MRRRGVVSFLRRAKIEEAQKYFFLLKDTIRYEVETFGGATPPRLSYDSIAVICHNELLRYMKLICLSLSPDAFGIRAKSVLI